MADQKLAVWKNVGVPWNQVPGGHRDTFVHGNCFCRPNNMGGQSGWRREKRGRREEALGRGRSRRTWNEEFCFVWIWF